MTLTAEEQEKVILGTLHIKRSETYQKAVKLFEHTKAKAKPGSVDTEASKLLIDEKNLSIKMEFVLSDEVKKKVEAKVMKEFEKIMKSINGITDAFQF